MIEIIIDLIVEAPFIIITRNGKKLSVSCDYAFIYLRQIRQHSYWTIVLNTVPVFLFKNWNHICIVKFKRKVKFRKNTNVVFNHFHRYITFLTSFFIQIMDFNKFIFFFKIKREQQISLPPMKCLFFYNQMIFVLFNSIKNRISNV